MRGVAPLCLLLAPVAALAVLFGGELGAGLVAVLGLLAAVLGGALVRGDERARQGSVVHERERATQFLVSLVIVGFVFRAALAVLLRELDLNLALGGDEGTFDANGRVFAAWLDGRIPQPFTSKWADTSQVGYFAVVGACYRVFGPVQLVPVLINCAFGACTAVPAFRIAARLGGAWAGRASAVLVTFFPSLVLWSCLMVRDAIVFFLIAWCVSLGQSLLRRVGARPVILLVVALALLATLRTYMFLLVAGALVAAFLGSIVRRPGRAAVVAAMASIAVIALVHGAGLGQEFLGEDVLARIDEQRRLNALVGRTAIDIGAHDLSTPVGAVTYLPVGLAYFFFAPFPWQMGGRQALALPDIVLWYACLPFVIAGVVHSLRRRRTVASVPLIAGLSIAVLYALVEGNVGIIVRHRAQMVVLLVPFAAVALSRMVRARARAAAAESERRRRLLRPTVVPRAGIA